MNDNDIIKALECCVGKSLKRYLCLKCPLRDRDCYGGALLMPAVLELINRQKAEIEGLKTKLSHSIGVDNTNQNGCFPFD